MNTPTVVKEWDILLQAPEHELAKGCHAVTEKQFIWLKQQALHSTKPAWLEMCGAYGRDALKIQSFVGVVAGPDGLLLEILPKMPTEASLSRRREILYIMLRRAGVLPSPLRVAAAQMSASKPLHEVFLWQFLAETEVALRKGMLQGYREEHGALTVVMGRINLRRQLRAQPAERSKVWCFYHEYCADRVENRILKKAVGLVRSHTRSSELRSSAARLERMFGEEVGKLRDGDMYACPRGRDLRYYASSIAWALLLLRMFSPASVAGDLQAPSLLFPMEKVFERCVGFALGQLPGVHVHAQGKNKAAHLLTAEGVSLVRLKPDFWLEGDEEAEVRTVVDAKWKAGGESKEETCFAQLIASDLYQLFAYAHSFTLPVGSSSFLVFPAERAASSSRQSYDYSGQGGYRLQILQYCFACHEIVGLREALSLKVSFPSRHGAQCAATLAYRSTE